MISESFLLIVQKMPKKKIRLKISASDQELELIAVAIEIRRVLGGEIYW